ncbi:MAG: hypothetical protein ACTSSG_09910 [Candidatus Heimdallarchaeaceae archaeon]
MSKEYSGTMYYMKEINSNSKEYNQIYNIVFSRKKPFDPLLEIQKIYDIKWKEKPFSWSYFNEFKPNRRWFFCGVDSDDVNSILNSGMQIRRKSDTNILGNGVYLSYHPFKAIEDSIDLHLLSCMIYAPNTFVFHPNQQITENDLKLASAKYDAIEIRSGALINGRQMTHHQICVFESKRVIPRYLIVFKDPRATK